MSKKKCYLTVKENGVAVMTVDNPPVNALSASVLADIKSVIKEALGNDKVRVVVFTGAGDKAFIAGADIKEFTGLEKKEEAGEFLVRGQEIANMMEGADKPFIAAINGFCLGGGMELALGCHIRLADEKAQLGLPEIKLGIIPGYGGTQRTPRVVGKARAMELVLSGNFLSGKQAAEYGLANRVAPAGTVLEEALKLAGDIALRSRVSVKAAMKAIGQGTDMDMPDALKLERDTFGEICESEDKKEGVAAFLEKRSPNFQDK